MTVTSNHYAVTSTRVKIVGAETGFKHAICHITGSKNVYIGGSDVTSSNGLLIDKAAGAITVPLSTGSELWAVCNGADTDTITVLLTD